MRKMCKNKLVFGLFNFKITTYSLFDRVDFQHSLENEKLLPWYHDFDFLHNMARKKFEWIDLTGYVRIFFIIQ